MPWGLPSRTSLSCLSRVCALSPSINSVKSVVFVHDHRFEVDARGAVHSNRLPAKTLSRYLRPGWLLTVIGRRRHVTESQLQPAEAEGVHFELFDSTTSPSSLLFPLSAYWRVVIPLCIRADLIVLRMPAAATIVPAMFAILFRRRTIIEVVCCPIDSLASKPWLVRRLSGIIALHLKWVARHASGCLYVTKAYLQNRYPCAGLSAGISDVEVVPVGNPQLERRLQRVHEAVASRRFRVGVLASLKPYKGIRDLIQLAAAVSMQVNSARFTFEVAGEGDVEGWRQEAKQQGVSELVDFVGPISGRSAVEEWLDGIDIYMQPSWTEGLPRAVVEAMSRGCPVLASKVGGIPELLSEEDLFEPRDVQGMRRALTKLVESAGSLQRAATRNHSTSKRYASDQLRRERECFLTACGLVSC